MAIEKQLVIDRALAEESEWLRWRARRLGRAAGESIPFLPEQDEVGAFAGPSGQPSPGATGRALCHLRVLGAQDSGAAVIAADWLESARTPAQAWLDRPEDVPGELETPAAGRVWATASASCALLAHGRDPGHRAIDLLRGEADLEGRFTGGAYPTFAAAGAYWLAEGPKTEMAEWALRWAREWPDDWWGPSERATALVFWGAAGIPAEHPSVESYLEILRDEVAGGEQHDLDVSLTLLELLQHFD